MSTSRAVRTSSPAMRRLVAALSEHGPMVGKKLCELASVSFLTFEDRVYKGKLIDEGLIHICGYQYNPRGSASPIYAIGPFSGDEAPRPPITSNAAKRRRWGEQTRYNDAYNEARRAARLLARPADPVLCALMGIRT